METISTIQLRCAARCDRYRNADSVSLSTIVHYRSLSSAVQRSRSGNTLLQLPSAIVKDADDGILFKAQARL